MTQAKKLVVLLSLSISLLWIDSSALAQNNSPANYPSRPIKVIVGFTAGGPTDIIARVLAKEMTLNLGQPVIVENIAGANSMIATNAALNAPADGYTLFCASLHFNVNPILKKNVYKPLQDFVAIEQVANLPMVMVTSPESPYKSVNDVVQAAKAHAGAINYAISGNGSSGHLAAEMFAQEANLQMTGIPYKGNGPALMDVMAGRVDFMFYPIVGVPDLAKNNRIRVLATGTKVRNPEFPGVPTMNESGFKGFEDTAPWVGYFAPKGTPELIVKKLNAAITKALATPEVIISIKNLGAEPVGGSPADFQAFLKADVARWTRIIKAANIKDE
jgi:tripartite-type tricarboxylate transporter receptor subunit TctC